MPAARIHTAVQPTTRDVALGDLRARIAKIEGHAQEFDAVDRTQVWSSGHHGLDAALGGQLGFGALHEIMAETPAHLPAASVFALGLIARLPRQGPLFWCMSRLTRNEHGAPYGPGLATFGIDPARIINANVHHPRDLSFVLEEAARLGSLAAIVAEGPLPSFTASRRLALLLAQSHVPMLFLPDGKPLEGSAATTRFIVSPIAAQSEALDTKSVDIKSPGPPAFRVTLARHRGGRPGLQFETVFDHASLSFTSPSFIAPSCAPLSGPQSDSVSDRQFFVGNTPNRRQRA